MKSLEFLLFILSFTVSVYCTWTDVNKNIVPNKILFYGFILSILTQIVYCYFMPFEYISHWIIVMVIADFIAILMYFFDMWAAGDSKLFCYLYFCVPCRLIDLGSMRSAVVPYIFIFLPALIWILTDSIYHTVKHSKSYVSPVKLTDFIKNWILIFINTTAFYFLMLFLFTDFIEHNGLFCSTLTMIYVYICNRLKFTSSVSFVIFNIIILSLLFSIGGVYININFLNNILIVMLVFLFQRWAGQYNYRDIKTSEVKKGMILSSGTILSFRNSRVKGLPEDFSEKISSRLTQNQVEAVHRWENSSKGKSEVTIVRKIPFAIFISSGFILWLIVLRCY